MGFIPAALQSNDVWGLGGPASALGVSQIVHFVVALAGFFNIQLLHVHSPPIFSIGAFTPAALQSNPPFCSVVGAGAGKVTGLLRSKLGREALGIALASSFALIFPDEEGRGTVKVKEGKDTSDWVLALSFAFFGARATVRAWGIEAGSEFETGTISFFSGSGAARAGASKVKREGADALETSNSAFASGAGEGGVEAGSGCMLNRSLLGSFGILDLGPKSVFAEADVEGGTLMTGILIGAGFSVSFFTAWDGCISISSDSFVTCPFVRGLDRLGTRISSSSSSSDTTVTFRESLPRDATFSRSGGGLDRLLP